MVYSASMVKALDAGKPATDFFTDQLLYVVFGAACALFLWKVVPYRFWVGPIVWAVWAVAVALIFAVWLAGTDHYGAQRWLYIGPVGLQPSEFCKIAFILVAVRLVVDWRAGLVESRATMVRALIFIIAPIALMYRTQSDLGTTAICFVGILAVMWMGGVSRRVIFACLGVAVLGGLVAIFGTGYRSDRLVFMDPWNDGEGGYGTGYNIIRSYYALAEGGIFGVGLGNSHEKFQYLFASESDFIFAVIGEELGLVGALFVIGLFFCVLYAGLAIAERAADDIGAMIAAACIRNLGEYGGKFTVYMGEINDIGGICLSLFLGMAMITLKIWQLAELALPLVVLLAGQTLFMILYSFAIVYNVMGRDYDAAVIVSGTCGFGMGATPNAMANMQAVCDKYSPSVKAYLLIPLVGSLFADFINSLVITVFINFI